MDHFPFKYKVKTTHATPIGLPVLSFSSTQSSYKIPRLEGELHGIPDEERLMMRVHLSLCMPNIAVTLGGLKRIYDIYACLALNCVMRQHGTKIPTIETWRQISSQLMGTYQVQVDSYAREILD